MYRLFLSGAVAFGVITAGLTAQTQPSGYHSAACIKINAGKGMEYRQFVNEYSRRLSQASADAGDTAGWVLLRGVMPAGTEARCDYVSITLFKAAPPQPRSPESWENLMKKSGVKSTFADFVAKRSSLTTLVSQELWQTVIRVAEVEKGDYMFVNFGKIPNVAKYIEFEQTIWKPMAEAMVKDGLLRAWMVNRAVLPSGTETKYQAVSVDVFPTWNAVFSFGSARAVFSKVHPDKNYEETFAKLPEIRNLARRELYVVEEKVTPAARVSSR